MDWMRYSNPASPRKSVKQRVMQRINDPPQSVHTIAADLHLAPATVERIVKWAKGEDLVDESPPRAPGYSPTLSLSAEGMEWLREQEPGWWKKRSL